MAKQYPLNERFRWLPTAGKTGRFYDQQTHRFVTQLRVREAIDDFLVNRSKGVNVLCDQYRSGEITLDEWRERMRAENRIVHVNAAVMARGGRDQMTPADWGRVGREVRKANEYLEKFTMDVASGKWPLDGRFNARAKMYVEAARAAHENERRRMSANAGLTQARRIQHSQEPCDDCTEEARKGWQPINDIRPIGDSRCRTHCLCTIEYR